MKQEPSAQTVNQDIYRMATSALPKGRLIRRSVGMDSNEQSAEFVGHAGCGLDDPSLSTGKHSIESANAKSSREGSGITIQIVPIAFRRASYPSPPARRTSESHEYIS
jgi:hypothetical protein